MSNLLAFNLDRVHTVHPRALEELTAFLHDPGEYSVAEKRLVLGGAVFQQGLAAVRGGGPDALAEIAALERLRDLAVEHRCVAAALAPPPVARQDEEERGGCGPRPSSSSCAWARCGSSRRSTTRRRA
ncbi:MAG: hypothetical protein U0168_19570 [Nannocystaceae bacterium]